MENMVGKNFESLAQRVIYCYAGTFPGFVPVKSYKASEHSQLELYGFIENMLQKLYEDPSLLALSFQEDDFYEDWALQKTKPKLIVEMKNYQKKINEFLMLLIKLGEAGTIEEDTLHVAVSKVKLTDSLLKRLERFGLACVRSEGEVVLSCKSIRTFSRHGSCWLKCLPGRKIPRRIFPIVCLIRGILTLLIFI